MGVGECCLIILSHGKASPINDNFEGFLMIEVRRSRPGVLLSIALLVIAGCDGGTGGTEGGGGSGTGPGVGSVAPSASATDVARDTTVTATFDKDMFAASIDGSSFLLRDSGGATVAAAVSYDEVTHTATLTPTDPLGRAITYQASLSSSISDLNGNAISSKDWSFTTYDGAWGMGSSIGGITAVRTPELEVDGDGRVLAVWAHGDYVRANQYDPDTGWGSEEILQQDTIRHIAGFDLAMDTDGNAMAVWTRHTSNASYGSDLIYSRYIAGSGWQAPAPVDSIDPRFTELDSNISVQFDAAGNAWASWVQYNDYEPWHVLASRYTPGGGWETAQIIDGGAGYAKSSRLLIDATGNVTALWLEEGTGDLYGSYDLWSRRYVVGSGWGNAQKIHAASWDTVKTFEADIDNAGNVLVVFDEIKDGNPDGYRRSNLLSTYYTEGAWGTAVAVEGQDFLKSIKGIRLDVHDQSGHALLVWANDMMVLDGTPNLDSAYIWSNRFEPATGWSGEEQISYYWVDFTGSILPSVAMDKEGNGMAVWLQSWNGGRCVEARRYLAGQGWGEFAFNPPHDGECLVNIDNGNHASMVIDSGGDITAVWSSYWTYGGYSVYANRFE
jgi:hypothetical protein